MLSDAQPADLHDNNRYRAPIECVRSARLGLAGVRNALTTLSGSEAERLLADAGMQLESAAGMLRTLQQPVDNEMRLEIEQLRRQLQTLALTLNESDRLVGNWLRRVAANAGYTAQGGTAPLVLVKKVNVTG